MTSGLFACSLIANVEAQADAKTREERSEAERTNGIFAVMQGPKANHEHGYPYGDADIGIPDKPFHFLRQKTSREYQSPVLPKRRTHRSNHR